MEISWLILEEDCKSHAPREASAGRSKNLIVKIDKAMERYNL
jgi:hypothetical protein